MSGIGKLRAAIGFTQRQMVNVGGGSRNEVFSPNAVVTDPKEQLLIRQERLNRALEIEEGKRPRPVFGARVPKVGNRGMIDPNIREVVRWNGGNRIYERTGRMVPALGWRDVQVREVVDVSGYSRLPSLGHRTRNW